MGALFVYILKSSVCLAAFYLFYRLLLSRETFYRFNRYALLGILWLSMLIPCYEVSTGEPVVEMQQTVMKLEKAFVPNDLERPARVSVILAPDTSATLLWTWQEVLLFVYLLGVLFFIARNLYSLIRMTFLLKRSRKIKLESGIVLVTHDSALAPFSWMKYIIVSNADLKEGREEILTHEQAHIFHYHSLDLLLAEVTILFQWFNPAAWLFKQELQNIHEYEADEAVLNQGIDAKQYQLLLIKKAVGSVRFNSLANSFNHSKLKKRITMMLKRKSNSWARLKYLYVLPVAAVAVVVFARSEVSSELNRISDLKVNDLIPDKEVIPIQIRGEGLGIGGMDIGMGLFQKNNEDPDEYSQNYLKELKTFIADHPQAWVVVDNVELSMKDIHPEELVESGADISVYTGERAKDFGEQGKRGVLLVNTSKEFFENVILKGGTFEGAQRALDCENVSMILDGERVACKSLRQVDGSLINDLKVDKDRVYVFTHTGKMVKNFVKKRPHALVMLRDKVIRVKDLKRSDYIGVKAISCYYGNESAQFGPKAKNGSLFVDIMAFRYALPSWKKEHPNMYVSSNELYIGSLVPDSLNSLYEEYYVKEK